MFSIAMFVVCAEIYTVQSAVSTCFCFENDNFNKQIERVNCKTVTSQLNNMPIEARFHRNFADP